MANANQIISVPKQPDSTVVRLFLSWAKRYDSAANFQATGGGRGVRSDKPEDEKHISTLAKSKANGLHHASVAIGNLRIAFWRGESQLRSDNSLGRTPSGVFDEFEIVDTTNTPESLAMTLDIVTDIQKHCGSGIAAAGGNRDSFGQLLAGHQAAIAQLEQTALSISEKLAESQQKLEDEFIEKSRKLDEKYELQKTANDTAHAERLKQLDAQSEALEARKKELDDRDNTHARRAIRSDLKQTIKSRAQKFEITSETQKLRWPIHAACIAGLCALFGVMLYSFANIPSGQLTDGLFWAWVVKQIGITVGFLGLLAYYVRWMNRWFDKHADTEFNLKQFDLDIDRANWVVETALEWRAAQGGVIPTVLLESVTRNLFANEDKPKEEMHPADYLASALLGKASAIKLKTGNAEIDLNARQVRKDLSKSDD